MNDPIGRCTAGAPKAGNEFQLFPAGKFRAQDGRPANLDGWVMTAQVAARMIAAFTAQKNPLLVDYEHQTELAADNGKPAPAAGWVHGLEWREGQGLYAVDVKWTEAARASIQADEYRYISPTFRYSPTTGEVLHLVNAALTNSPALDGMEAAVALRLRYEAQGDELASLRQESALREINDLVEKSAAAGCLLPYQMDAARELAVSNLAALKILLDRPPLIHFGEIATFKRRFGAEAAHGLNWAELRMCELSGRSPEEFAALKTRFTPDE